MTSLTLHQVPVTSCEGGLRARLTQFCIPTIADVLFVMLLLRVLQLGATNLFNDPGTGWHLRIGDGILASRHVPATDTFSYTRQGCPWVETQWLGDVVMSLAFRLGGYSLLALVTATLLAALFRWIYRTHVAAGGWPAIAAVTALVAAGAASGHFLARPLVATSIGVPLCFWWTTQYARGEIGARRLWLLVPLAAIWASIHPGVLGGAATVVICGAGEAIRIVLGRLRHAQPSADAGIVSGEQAASVRRAMTIVTVGMAMAAATLLNPYGLDWHRQVVRLMSMPSLARYVDEWLPPVWNAPDTIAACLLAAATGVAMVVRRTRTTIAEVLVILFWLWQGSHSARHLPLVSMIVALQFGRVMRDIRIGPGRLSRIGARIPIFSASMRETERHTPGGLVSLVSVAVLAALLVAGIRVPAIGLGVARLPEKKYSSAAIEYLRSHRLPGPLFNDLDYGGMLIHRLPEVPVFIDDRFELYGEELIEESRAAVLDPAESADPLLDRWNVQTVLMRNSLPMAAWLANNPAWTQAYRDRVVAIYTRVPTSNPAAP